jgi:hypothetical protein
VPDDRVACTGDYRMRSYLLYRPDFSREVVYLRKEDLAEKLRDKSLRAVYAEGGAEGVRTLEAAGFRAVGPRLYLRGDAQGEKPR